MNRLFQYLICFLGFFATSDFVVAQDASPTASELKSLLDDVWDFELTEFPQLATNVGDPRGQDRLADESIKAIERRHRKQVEFLDRLNKIDLGKLNDLQQVDHELLKRRLASKIADFKFSTHLVPISNRSGFHIDFPELPKLMNPQTKEDFANYVSRLNAFGEYAEQQIELLRLGAKAGLTQPSIILRGSLGQTNAQIVKDPAKSIFLEKIEDGVREKLGDHWPAIEKDIRAAIVDEVVPAYQRFAEFLQTEYLPTARGTIGASALPNGREFYIDRVKYFTTIDISPEQLHEIGIQENARIRKEMEAIREKVSFEGDLPAFLKHLRTDPKFYPKTAEELMMRAALILKRADGRLPEVFGKLPRTPYGLLEIPPYIAPQTTSAYYWPPATDGSRGGNYYLNTYNLSSRPLYQLEALSLHEAVPGHHLQLALQAELTNLHPISRESSMTAFIEGWALYSERLGKEIGFYTDPYQDFGRLSMEAWRASRLVVDTGIHWMGWTRQQAIDYMTANTALSEHNVVAEVDRYIGWPGQALAYKTGELAISRMRKEAEAELGSKFDIRSFHDRVLEVGAIPLPLLEKRVKKWVSEQSK